MFLDSGPTSGGSGSPISDMIGTSGTASRASSSLLFIRSLQRFLNFWEHVLFCVNFTSCIVFVCLVC